MFNPLLIYSNTDQNPPKPNTPIYRICDNNLIFSLNGVDFNNSDIDTYISQEVIPIIKEKDFNIIFIKDNLSDNYLELYGILLAYHIRLTEELGDKRFLPIVILSDVDGYILNKLTPMANILFTKNIFIAKNETSSYEYFKKVFDSLTAINSFKEEFLNHITIEPPQDYLSHHSIANEWSIYRWAEFLKVDTNAIKTTKSKIDNMLYFKFLKALNIKDISAYMKINKPTKKGKVLLIDDEWDKGWEDILGTALTKEGLVFKPFVTNYQDRDGFNNLTYDRIANENPDVVILDLRLVESDHENEDIENYSGIKILQKIHEINAGIQVIMLTATSKSTILDKLYEKKILGYIKKEHPNDSGIDTVDNINKFVKLVDKGLERKFLKEIWCIQKDILQLNILQVEFSFDMDDSEKKLLELKNTVSRIFETLDSNIPKPFVYAMLTIFKSIEIICDYYIYENYNQATRVKEAYWIGNRRLIYNDGNTSINNKIKSILRLLEIENEASNRIVNQLTCSRNFEIHSGEIKRACENKVVRDIRDINIIAWFGILKSVIIKMDENQ